MLLLYVSHAYDTFTDVTLQISFFRGIDMAGILKSSRPGLGCQVIVKSFDRLVSMMSYCTATMAMPESIILPLVLDLADIVIQDFLNIVG